MPRSVAEVGCTEFLENFFWLRLRTYVRGDNWEIMTAPLVPAFEHGTSQCAAADLDALSADDVASRVVDMRRVATRLEAEIARTVHAASQVEVWRAGGGDIDGSVAR